MPPTKMYVAPVQQRPVLDAHAQVGADRAANVALKYVLFEHVGVVEPQKVGVGNQLGLGRNVEVHAHVEQLQARIDEIGLALELARTEIGNQAHALRQVDAQQLDRLPLPRAELTTSESRIVEDRVEAAALAIVDVVIARGVKERRAKPHPVAIVRQLDRGHLGIDAHRPTGQRVEAIVPQSPIKRMRDVEAVDASIAGPTQINRVDRMRLKDADRIGTSQEAVLIKIKSA